jgi:hypothetical protein
MRHHTDCYTWKSGSARRNGSLWKPDDPPDDELEQNRVLVGAFAMFIRFKPGSNGAAAIVACLLDPVILCGRSRLRPGET